MAHLVVDTNILLLLFIGLYDTEYITDCPLMTENGKNYTREHFALLKKILERFVNKIVITPQVLSEIYTHSHRIKPKDKFYNYFLKVIEKLKECKENHVDLEFLLRDTEKIIEFGFTDMSIVETANKNKWVILTDEFEMYRVFNTKVDIISFSKVASNEIYLK